MISLKKQAISGFKWTFVVTILGRIISMATMVVLARILSPADFGLFALAFVMIDGFSIFKSLGFDSALVRRKDDIERACNTAFFLIPVMGMILFFILFFFAPVGAQFLNNPQVAPIIRVLGLVFVISTFGKVPQTVLYRDMKFKYKSIAELSAAVAYCAMALVLALNKFGVWSLVIAYILKTAVQIGMEWYFSGWKPKFEFDKTIAWDMFYFGKYVLASGIIWFLYSNLDNIVIGKVLGVTMLGYYAIAMNLSTFLSQYLLDRVGFIMYPAYSRIQEDPEDVKRVMLKVLKYISIILFPFSFGLFIFAPDILRLVFGEKWLAATNILRILAFVGMLRGMSSVIWPIFAARGQAKADFQVNLAQVAIFFLLIVPLALKFKLIGVGVVVLLSAVISFSIGLLRLRKIIDIKFSRIFAAVRQAMLASILMLVGAMLLKFFPITKIQNFDFLISAGVASALYSMITYFMNKNILNDVKEVLI